MLFSETTSSAQLNSTRFGVGANVDFENALAVESTKSVPYATGHIRFGDRWRVEGEYFRLNRSGSRSIDRDIQFGDRLFPVNAEVSSEYDFSDIRLSLGYSFFRRPDKELGAGLGVHIAQYNVALTSATVGSEAEKLTAPLPVLSLYGQFALTDRWAIAGRMDRFRLNYSSYHGNITGIALDLMYQPFKNLGFGLGTRALNVALDAERENRLARFKHTIQGPTLFVNASF